jgi:hypothetical protein
LHRDNISAVDSTTLPEETMQRDSFPPTARRLEDIVARKRGEDVTTEPYSKCWARKVLRKLEWVRNILQEK